MTSFNACVQTLLVRDLKGFRSEIEAFPSSELVWTVHESITNSAGVLAMHGCGNLNHYIGKVLGGSNYVRNRNLEFETQMLSTADICAEIDRTIAMLESVLPSLDSSVLERVYPEKVGGNQLMTRDFLLHLCTHLSFHLGQAGYLRRMITGQPGSTNPISVAMFAK